jgi:hypothetical protein
MSTAKTSPAKKSASSEAVIGNAAVLLSRSLTAVKEATANLEKLAETAEEKQYKIAELESKIDSLNVDFAEKERAGKIKLDLDLKAYQLEGAKNVAASNGMSLVKTSEYDATLRDFAKLKADFSKNVSDAVLAETSKISVDYANKKTVADAEHRATNAALTADLTSAKAQVEFYKNQVEALYKQLDAERSAGIERAKASSVGSITVAAPVK